ncbi:MAG TPA: phosphotransferase [Gaiellaceae bacterium]|nr:phosphotransferase [Gaiellaceae bacterium]
MRWTEPAWLARAEAWIHERVAVTGELDQFHVRWWSTVIRVPTRDEDLYFKAVAPGFEFEPALTVRLYELAPDRVTPVVDADLELGWMLMRDAGTRLRELVLTPADLRHWELALPRYAELQIAAMPIADELLGLGVPDARLEVLPDQLRTVLAEPVRGLTTAEQEQVLAALPELESLCRELAAYGIAETIQHDDLHDGQVFFARGRYLFFDWGDSCISHPFHSLTVNLRAAAAKLDLEPGGAEVRRLRDAYLEPFGDLREAADLAYRTGTVGRALAWDRFVRSGFGHLEPDDDLATAYGLKLFLANGPIGTWREPPS